MGGVVGEDDEFIASASAEDSWWDGANEEEDKSGRKVVIDTSKEATIDAKTIVSSNVPDVENYNTLPFLHTKIRQG